VSECLEICADPGTNEELASVTAGPGFRVVGESVVRQPDSTAHASPSHHSHDHACRRGSRSRAGPEPHAAARRTGAQLPRVPNRRHAEGQPRCRELKISCWVTVADDPMRRAVTLEICGCARSRLPGQGLQRADTPTAMLGLVPPLEGRQRLVQWCWGPDRLARRNHDYFHVAARWSSG